MRLLHTSDIRLDACHPLSGADAAYGARRRKSRLDVFLALIDRARAWPADALLIAGDLFHTDRLARGTRDMLRGALASLAPISVCIAAGRHDAATPDSPYRVEPWPGNVTLFLEPGWSTWLSPHTPLAIHGFGWNTPDLDMSPLASWPTPVSGRANVALAYAPSGDMALSPDEVCLPPEGLAYTALGGLRDSGVWPGAGQAAVHFSGTPEGLGFHEPGPRHWLEVELTPDGVEVHRRMSSRTLFTVHRLDVTHLHDLAALRAALAAFQEEPGAPRQVARIILEGVSLPWVGPALEQLRKDHGCRFDCLILDDHTDAADHGVSREPTSRGAFYRRMGASIDMATQPTERARLTRARLLGMAAFDAPATPGEPPCVS